jgi:hypothetical protein
MGNRWLLLLLTLTFLASSCSSDDDETPINDYCYIKSVTLGTVKRKIEKRDAEGNIISTVNAFFAGSGYAMTIDQRTGIIENRDSLPYGSQLSAVLATITFDGSLLNYLNANGEWIAYNAEDSLNLSNPLKLQLTSNDGLTNRAYTLQINVHKQEGDSLYWNLCEKEVTELTGMTDMKTFVMDDKLMVLGNKTTGIVLAERSDIDAQGTWKENTTDLPLTADLQTLRQQGGKLFLSTTDKKILSSTDAKTWTQEGTTYTSDLTLLEKTDKFFYAISVIKDENSTTCTLLRSADATTWEKEVPNPKDKTPNPDDKMLPSSEIRTLTVQQANGSSRIIMLGQSEGSNYSVVWNKSWNNGWKISEEEAQWMYFPITGDNTIPCPRMSHLNLLSYDGQCIAFGGTLDAMYISRDYGITWRPDTDLHLPVQLKGNSSCTTSVVDKNNYIWIITNAQVWRGRLNRLGFAQQ